MFVYRVNTQSVCDSVHFAIQAGNDDNKFYIDNTGRIYTNAALDYERNSSFNLTVRALHKNASGDYTLQATPDDTWVNITVGDVNEAPYWNPSEHIVHFCFNASTGEVIHTLTAIDPDTVPSIKYNSSTGPSDPFYVNSTDGSIIKGSFDLTRLPLKEFNFTVKAFDKNDSSLRSDNETLSVTIRWCDTRVPVFTFPFLRNFSIMENDVSFRYQIGLNFRFILTLRVPNPGNHTLVFYYSETLVISLGFLKR